MNFLFDNNLSPKLASALNRLVAPEHSVVHLIEKFESNTPDAQWMTELAQEPGWIIVTADWRISRNPHEVRAWKAAGHTIFFLKPGWLNLNFWTQAAKFTNYFPAIIEKAGAAAEGSGFLVSVQGKIERL